MKLFLVIIIFLVSLNLPGQEQQVVVPYTLADRDRAIKTEARIGALETRVGEIENKIEDTNRKIDRLEDKFDRYFMWEFGLVLVAVFGLVGFIIYDRRAILSPIESRTERIINVLKDAAEQNPAIRDSMKRNAL